MSADLVDDLTQRLVAEYDCDDATASAAADYAAELVEEFETDHDAEAFLDRIEAAPYDEFERRWNWAVGDICADLDDCTDSRDFRFAGYDDIAAQQ